MAMRVAVAFRHVSVMFAYSFSPLRGSLRIMALSGIRRSFLRALAHSAPSRECVSAKIRVYPIQ